MWGCLPLYILIPWWFLPAPSPPFLWCWSCCFLWGILLIVNAHIWELSPPAYKELPRDPTSKIKAQLITKLRRIKKESKLDEGTYKAMYPTGCVLPKFYGLPKIHKTGKFLRPIVSSRGSVTYGIAKVLSKVIKPLVIKSPPPYTKYWWLCYKGQKAHSPSGRVPVILWCHFTFHFSSNRSSPKHH